MLSDFLYPINHSIIKFKESLPEQSNEKKIISYKNNETDFSKIEIALNEYRGTNNSTSTCFKTNVLRKELYTLFIRDWDINLIDIGDVINDNLLSDIYYATKTIFQTLIKNNVIPFLIGGSQDLMFYESELTQKWWLELNDNCNNSKVKSLIPCNYQDYLDAKNQKFSDRIILSLKRNFV